MVTFSLPKNPARFLSTAVIGIYFFAGILPASATTKGLSQIVTPDIQPEGELGVSLQLQDKKIANPFEVQAELGITKQFEVAVFQGLDPQETIFASEFGIIQHEPYLLTVGFINWSTRGQAPQPFLEGGYYTEHHKFIAGPIVVNGRTELILGWAYDFNKTWRFQLDYQSGRSNFATVGFTCNVTKNFQFNPAIYFSNDNLRQVSGYIVFSYAFSLWKHSK
jgi:hypothetical protein